MVQGKFSHAIRWLASHDLAVLPAVLIVVAGTWGFITLASRWRRAKCELLTNGACVPCGGRRTPRS